ncbi:unnamed protein product [Lota lota]
MNLRSAARGFLAFLLSVPALQSNDDWRVTYSPSNVCALRGAMVDISCTYKYPANIQYPPTTVTTLWFTKGDNYQPVDLLRDTDYTDRVEYSCGEVSCTGSRCHGKCTLRIKDLRTSDSAVYKFRFTTNQPGGEYTGDPGVKLSVTDLQVKVSFPQPTYSTWTELECHSMCGLTGYPPYIWFRNGQNVGQEVNYRAYIQSEDSFSCAVGGYDLHSPLVYAPKTPSVTVSPSGAIEEGSSVTLSCSSDANPAAKYTWLKVNTDRSSRVMNQRQQLVFSYILSSDSGQYRCEARNELGTKSKWITINVKYAPKTPSVTVSPSGEIEEGSSVTLSCSSDANPAAKYTWFKVNTGRSSRVMNQRQQLVFSYILSSDSGQYCCEAMNELSTKSKLISINVKYAPKTPSVTVRPSGEIEEGSSVTLSCSSDANPAANYTWFMVNTDGSSRAMNEGQQLVFKNILSSNSGQYRCDARNKLGTESKLITINVKYAPKTPSVTVSPSGEIEEGSSVSLSCSSDANPAAKYTWFKNNQPLVWKPSQPYTFPSVRPEDRGTYRCHAENKYGHLSSNSLFMDVKYAPKTPSVTVSPSGEIKEGSSVTLSCSSDANPAAKYTWFKNNQPLVWKPSQPYSFSSVRPEDRGTYRCHAENKYGHLSSNSLFMDVKYAPKTPSVTVSPSGEIKEGSSVTLSCSSNANPAAKYTWFQNNQPLVWKPSQPYTFPSVRPEDRGTYHCHAENKYGHLSSNSLFMDVKYAPKTPSVTVSPSGEIQEGRSVTLSCSSDANPAAKYTWFKVNTGRSSRVMNQGQQLVFSNILSSDSGQYLCEAKNKLGPKKELITINVKYAPKTPSVTVSPSGEIQEGRSVTLSCSSDANPAAKYTWFKVNTGRSSRVMNQGQQLVFSNILSSDSGQYLCEAKNKLGPKKELITINVKYAPKTPSVTVSPSGEIKEGSSVTLSCSSDANPAAKYTWFQNNQPLVWKPSQPYTFPSVRPEDRGTYHCHAENKYGHLSSNSLFMDVNYVPKTPSVTVSPSGEIEEGSSVTLSCSSDANPAANYTWFKEHEISVKESGQNYTITYIISELGGNYYCQAHNAIGLHNSTFLVIKVAVTTIVVLLATLLLLVFLWMR